MPSYVSQVIDTFLMRRNTFMVLSPLDYTVVVEWEKQEIPLHVVLRSINEVFDNLIENPKRRASIKSISYCADQIEENYENWLQSQVGKSHYQDIPDKFIESFNKP